MSKVDDLPRFSRNVALNARVPAIYSDELGSFIKGEVLLGLYETTKPHEKLPFYPAKSIPGITNLTIRKDMIKLQADLVTDSTGKVLTLLTSNPKPEEPSLYYLSPGQMRVGGLEYDQMKDSVEFVKTLRLPEFCLAKSPTIAHPYLDYSVLYPGSVVFDLLKVTYNVLNKLNHMYESRGFVKRLVSVDGKEALVHIFKPGTHGLDPYALKGLMIPQGDFGYYIEKKLYYTKTEAL